MTRDDENQSLFGIDRGSHEQWKSGAKDYKVNFYDALKMAREQLEKETPWLLPAFDELFQKSEDANDPRRD